MNTEKLGDHLMVVYGPPGTGKTTRVLELLESELEQGIPPDQIAFATFTKAARLEAMERAMAKFELSHEELCWFRTLHSTAYHLLGMTKAKMFTPKHHKEFCARFHYEMTADKKEDDDNQIGAPPRRTRDDDLRAVHEWAIHRRLTPQEAYAKSPRTPISLEMLELYIARFTAYKEQEGVLDFNDMLIRGVKLTGPPVQVAIIDEAQDLSPLQIAACYAWYCNCDRVYVAGDDDQAIYLFAGADPAWMIQLQKVCSHYEVLDQSYRVPSAIKEVAERIITHNKRRVDKPYRSAKEGGTVICTTQRKAAEALLEHEARWTTYILVRNRFFAQRWAAELMRHGVPFWSEIGSPGPLGKKRLCKAVLAARRLLQGRDIDGVQLRAILEHVPSGEFCPRGIKNKSKGFEGRVTRMQMILEWNLARLVERFEKRGPALGLLKVNLEHLEYLDRVLKRLGDLPVEPNVRIMTIHASKGREANTVIVTSDMAKASWLDWQRDPEGENRVAYVAVTRAKDELVICDPETPRHYPYWDFVRHKPLEEVPF